MIHYFSIQKKIFDFIKIKSDVNNNNIKVALCTMGKKENLYVKEFVDYYIKIGVDHLFIYDDNDPNEEKISDIINDRYKNFVTIYTNINNTIKSQSIAFTNCYHNNLNKYDWFIMLDMDEYLHIVNDTLKNYLSKSIFDKCDFIKIHWVFPKDNNLIYYDQRPLSVRFKGPYIKNSHIKSIIRGNISDLRYRVHSPSKSPKRNITCNNKGKKIFYRNINFEYFTPINVEKAYIIHYRFKSTEEFINKYKRGYNSQWFRRNISIILHSKLKDYLQETQLTLEKLNYIEKELKLNLFKYKLKLKTIAKQK